MDPSRREVESVTDSADCQELDPSVGDLAPGRPLGVYVHFPFCRSRCPYCDFAAAAVSPIPQDAYADAVIAELGARWGWYSGAQAPRSVYFGGGTPGLWRPDALGRVLKAVLAQGGAEPSLEITVEANPGELNAEVAQGLVAGGVNRLSLGIQAFQDHLLQRIGRTHDAAAAATAVRVARQAGIENLCADLMFGLPEQTMDDWQRSLDALVGLSPEHITAYALTVERGTPFGALERAGTLVRPDEEMVAAMYTRAHDVLTAAGYEHYEISSYARPGRRSLHNTLYWTGGAYLGLGASASSFRPLADGTGWRFSNPRSWGTYLKKPWPAQVERRSTEDLENEGLWLSLRTSDGVDRVEHARRYGRDPLSGRSEAAQRCAHAGWLEVTESRVRLTAAGFLFADEVAARLWC